jgi:hypothetical protein
VGDVAEALGARTTLTQSCFTRYRGFSETTVSILNSLNSWNSLNF